MGEFLNLFAVLQNHMCILYRPLRIILHILVFIKNKKSIFNIFTCISKMKTNSLFYEATLHLG